MKAIISTFLLCAGMPLAFAQSVYMQACFNSAATAAIAHKKLEFIRVPIDRLQQDANCVDIQTSERRKALFEKFLTLKFGQSYELSEHVQARKSCHLQLIRIGAETSKQTGAKLGKAIGASQSKLNTDSKTVTELVISNGQRAQIGNVTTKRVAPYASYLEGSVTGIKCDIRRGGYQLEITMAGSDSQLSVSRFLPLGATIELGGIDQGHNDNGTKAGLGGIELNNSKGAKSSRYLIKAKNIQNQ